jgi:hypothetical protein
MREDDFKSYELMAIIVFIFIVLLILGFMGR